MSLCLGVVHFFGSERRHLFTAQDAKGGPRDAMGLVAAVEWDRKGLPKAPERQHELQPLSEKGKFSLRLSRLAAGDQPNQMRQHPPRISVLELMQDDLPPSGRQLDPGQSRCLSNPVDIAGRMGKIENAHRIGPMAIDKAL